MSYVCPVCNGLIKLNAICHLCQEQLDDYGKLEQLYDPYSPYREIDALKMTNGYDDYRTHHCIHIATCTNCNKNYIIQIDEFYQG